MIDIAAIAPDLRLAEDGIWYSPDTQPISYPSDGNDACFALEDSSFWFAHRNDCIVAAASKFPPPVGGTIVDVGGGNGFVARGLLRAGFEVVLLEPGAAGAHNARKRGVQHIVCATTETARIKNDSIPAVGLFDVIEHIENDGAFLRSLRSKVRRGGYLYATVPAFNALWAKDDEEAGHFRRYSRSSISRTNRRRGVRDRVLHVHLPAVAVADLSVPCVALSAPSGCTEQREQRRARPSDPRRVGCADARDVAPTGARQHPQRQADALRRKLPGGGAGRLTSPVVAQATGR